MANLHRSSSASSSDMPDFKFPHLQAAPRLSEDAVADTPTSPTSGPPRGRQSAKAATKDERWQPKRQRQLQWANERFAGVTGRARQKSLSEALRTIKGRSASVSENAHEIADALKAPVSMTLTLLCAFWYMTSIFSNASSKAILTAFRFPVTLTIVQFAFVCGWCIVSSHLAHRFTSLQTLVPALKYKIRRPSRELIVTTLPLTAFQIGGHILNSDAMARIPVSLVHTIKGLSPLLTVLAYRMVFRVKYSRPTYLSLVPLTLGVVMACSANFKAETVGLTFAFGSTVLFVTQNIVSKKLFNEAAQAESEGLAEVQASRKPDKLNLLCYSSGLALILTFPLWIWSEGLTLLGDILSDGTVELSPRPDALDHGRLAVEFIFNGTFHFAQSLVAFVLLSRVSPVTYSVASLIKRVFVITFAVVWFGNPLTRLQACGIGMTFLGLYLYDRTSDAARADRRVKALQARNEAPLLPLINEDKGLGIDTRGVLHLDIPHRAAVRSPSNSRALVGGEQKRDDSVSRRKLPADGWLPPGTRQEKTWKSGDVNGVPNGHSL